MGRIYDIVKVDSGALHAIFDPGAVKSYMTQDAVNRLKFKPQSLKNSFRVGLGGTRPGITKFCTIEGCVKGTKKYTFNILAYIIKYLGKDEYGKNIDLLFGSHDMQDWNIQIDIKNEKLDLTHFRREFIELYEVL